MTIQVRCMRGYTLRHEALDAAPPQRLASATMIGRRTATLLFVASSAVAACTSPAVDVPVEAAPVTPATSDVDLPPPPTNEPPSPSAATRTSIAAARANPWLTDEPTAVRFARDSRRPLVIDFHAVWCAACEQFDDVTFADTAVRMRLARFVKLRIDATNEDDPAVGALMRKYRISGLPAILLFDSSGIRQADVNEFMPPEAFAQKLDAVH